MENHSRPPIPPLSSDYPREARRMPGPASAMVNESTSPSIAIGDIYYTLFRHKWKIILCALAGLGAAVAFYLLKPPPYLSEARLFIRYVMETKGVSQPNSDVQLKSIDKSGETIINSEVAILTSLDLAKQVAQTVGPNKIISAGVNSVDDLDAAALAIQGGLFVETGKNSSVLQLVFAHPNPTVVQPVLTEIIEHYLKRHVEIHRSSGMVGGFLAQETDQLRARLTQTEDELRKARNKAGVISLEDSKKSNAEQIARLRQEILTAQAELSERSSILQEMTNGSTASTQPTKEGEQAPVPTEQVNLYQKTANRLALLFKREQEYLGFFTEESSRVRETRAQITEVEEQKKKLETDFPGLTRIQLITAATATQPAGTFNPSAAAAQITATQAKIKTLNAQLAEVRAEVAKTDEMEGIILQLTRQKELEETNYRNYSASLEQSRINEALGSGSVSNITQIQTPSPPIKDMKKSIKIIGGLAVSGLVFGLAWAFGIELFLDRSVRRPIDVERMLRLPLFLSIPQLSKKELSDSAAANALKLPAPKADSALAVNENKTSEIVPWDSEHALHPFHETLRDRLISYFESKGLTHKPKLVAVTGIGHGGGVTTTAAGLASSLSKTGDGNVLLVDMTQGQGSAQQFYQGNAVCGLEEILDARESAQIEGNLYVVGQEPGGEKLSRILPQRFNKLVPKLKASNFDYIVFDMPPVSQISITPRLASYMDMVLMVIESEKTDKDIVQRATALLAESKAHVGAVLNKTKTYVPLKLHQDNLGNL